MMIKDHHVLIPLPLVPLAVVLALREALLAAALQCESCACMALTMQHQAHWCASRRVSCWCLLTRHRWVM
jgi:hypothetical protein